MLQGSTMTTSHKGMRRGISLIEMLMAIVLLGILGGISYNYYKVYYDVAFAAKQAKVYVIIDQAVQISGAHDLYTVKNGIEPTTMADMVTDRQLVKIPDAIPEITVTGWVLENAIDINGTAVANDVAFTYAIDQTIAGGTVLQDQLDYCNILTNTSSTATWSLTSTGTDIATAGTDIKTGYTQAVWGNDFYCYGAGTDAAQVMTFIKRIDPS